jgi:hypothetical protein
MPDPETEDLTTGQIQREAIERERARHAELSEEEKAAERRADKAAYLREQLEKRGASEDEQG